MARPKSLITLFKMRRPPAHLDRAGTYDCYYVIGLKEAFIAAGIEVKTRAFKPHLKHARATAKKSSWFKEFPHEHLWKDFSPKQVDQVLTFRPVTLPKAALTLLAAERMIKKAKGRVLLYKYVRLVPALSYISDLTFEIFQEFRTAVEADATVKKKFKNFDKYLRKSAVQDDDQVFHDMVRGKTVTRALAAALLKLIKQHLCQSGQLG